MIIRNSLAAMLVLAASTLIAAQTVPVLAQERPLAERPLPVIRVSGEGNARVAPDLAIVTLGILREGDTARTALDAHKKVAADLSEAMRAVSIKPEDLQTANFSIQPHYVYPNANPNGEQQPPRIVGYQVSSELVVRLRDIAVIGDVLDKAVTLGVNSDGSIQFTNDDPSPTIARARADAMKDAMQRAKTLADAAGVTLGPVIEISESMQRSQPMPITRGKLMMEAGAADGVRIESGENAYTLDVQAVFEIHQPQ